MASEAGTTWWHDVFADGPVVVYRLDATVDGLPLEVTPNFQRLTGTSLQALVASGRGLPDLIHPEDRPRADEAFGRAVADGSGSVRLTYRALTPHGPRWVDDYVCIRRDPQGVPTEFVGYLFDVSEHRRTQRDLDQIRRRMDALFDAAAVGLVELDATEAAALLLDAGLECAEACERWVREDVQRAMQVLEGLRVERMNPIARRLLGPRDHLGPPAGSEPRARDPDGSKFACVAPLVAALLRGDRGATCEFTSPARAQEPSRSLVAHFAAPISIGDRVKVSMTVLDVTRLRSQEEALDVSEAFFRGTSEGIAVLAPDGSLEQLNPAMQRLLAGRPGDVAGAASLGLPWGDVLDSTASGDPWSGVIEPTGSGSRLRTTITPLRREDTAKTRYLLIAEGGATERGPGPEPEPSARDLLTGALSRRGLVGRLQAPADEAGSAFFVVSLDGFRLVNEALGQAGGDEVLRALVRRLRQAAPDAAELARVGGDQFGLLLRGAKPGEVDELARRLVEFVRAPLWVQDQRLAVRASVGVAVLEGHGRREHLLDAALEAVRIVKARGGNGSFRCDAAMTRELRRQHLIERALPDAIRGGQLSLAVQPQFFAHSGAVAGAEFLVRWRHPQLGPVRPDVFVGIAERAGYSVELGAWVLREAVERFADWSRLGVAPERFAINVSRLDLRGGRFAGRVLDTVEAFGVAPRCLEVEITETAAFVDPAPVVVELEQLRSEGVTISLDDFGTGYASLSSLKTLPLGCLKVDRTLVEDVQADPRDRAVVEAVVRMCGVHGIRVVAEGVETEDQRRALAEAGCDVLQGYLLARPMPVELFPAWMAERQQAP